MDTSDFILLSDFGSHIKSGITPYELRTNPQNHAAFGSFSSHLTAE